MNSRRGASLVEMIAVMSGLTVVLTVSAALMHRTMQAQSRTRYFFDGQRTALRLADQFRRDVHRATGAVTDAASLDEATFLRLELPEGQSVAYRRVAASVVRVLTSNGDAVAREAFRLSSLGELSLREEAAPRRLVLEIAARPEDALPTLEKPALGYRDKPLSLQIEASVGRDWRFTPDAAAREASP